MQAPTLAASRPAIAAAGLRAGGLAAAPWAAGPAGSTYGFTVSAIAIVREPIFARCSSGSKPLPRPTPLRWSPTSSPPWSGRQLPDRGLQRPRPRPLRHTGLRGSPRAPAGFRAGRDRAAGGHGVRPRAAHPAGRRQELADGAHLTVPVTDRGDAIGVVGRPPAIRTLDGRERLDRPNARVGSSGDRSYLVGRHGGQCEQSSRERHSQPSTGQILGVSSGAHGPLPQRSRSLGVPRGRPLYAARGALRWGVGSASTGLLDG
jgi:hypothetical protein